LLRNHFQLGQTRFTVGSFSSQNDQVVHCLKSVKYALIFLWRRFDGGTALVVETVLLGGSVNPYVAMSSAMMFAMVVSIFISF
jgi:hypothetical protein